MRFQALLDLDQLLPKSLVLADKRRRRLARFRLKTMKAVTFAMKMANAESPIADQLKARLEEMQFGESQHAGYVRYIAQHPDEFGV